MSIASNNDVERLHLPTPPPKFTIRPRQEMTPRQCAERVALAAVEIINGYRNPHQMQPWVSPEIYGRLVRRSGLAKRIGKVTSLPSRVMRSSVFFPSETICEASIVVHDSRKPRACAVRLEIRRGKWKALALDVI